MKMKSATWLNACQLAGAERVAVVLRGGSYSAVERLLELDGAHGLRVLVPLLPPVVGRGNASLLVIFSIHHNVS